MNTEELALEIAQCEDMFGIGITLEDLERILVKAVDIINSHKPTNKSGGTN